MAVWRTIGVGLVVFGTCIVPSARAEDAGRAPAQSGMRAYIDPQTGRFVPAPVDPSQRPQPAPTRPPVQALRQPDGSLEIKFDERHRHNVVATLDADGKVRLGCVTGDGSHEHPGE
jgi:hypothetical protein